nr:hypothetical protein [Tanacetum cinerariifolium]
MPQEPIVFNQDPDENSSQSPHIDHRCCYGYGDSLDGIFCQRCTCKSCGKGAHYGDNCPPKDSNYSDFDNFQPSQSVIDHLNLQQIIDDSMIELCGTFQAWLQQRKDQVVNLDSYSPKPLQYRKIPICHDDDDGEESSTPLRDIIISELPSCIAITPVLSTKEPKDSLIMRDEHLDTIPEKESDEFIKFSVENLVPNLSESEDERNLFEPFFDEEIISIRIDPHHFCAESDLIESLLNQDSSIISSFKIDSLLDEFADELIFLKSIPVGIDEADCDPEEEIRLIEKLLYDNSSPRPLEEINSEKSDVVIKSFSSSPVPIEDSDSLMEEIDLSLTPDDSMPPGIENDEYDSKGDIIILEELLSNDSLSLPKNESFHFDIPSSLRPPAKPPDDDEIEPNLEILTVIMVGDISEHYILMPRLLPTQPTLASNQEKSSHLLSHRGLKAFKLSSESLMMIYGGNIPILDVPFLHFYPPKLAQVWGDRVKLSDLKQALRERQHMLILVVLMNNDNESFFDEDISKEIYSNPLFDEEIISMKINPHHFNAESDLIESLLNHDSSIISYSLKIDSLLDEFAGELILLKSIPLGIDKADCDPEEEIRLMEKLLYDNSSPRPLEEFISENYDAAIESFSPSPISVEDSNSFMKEIDLSFTPNDSMPPGIEEDDYDFERDMLIFEELLSNDFLSLPENESFHFDIPSFPRPPAKPPDDDSRILTVKMVGDISKHDVPMPKLLPTQPTLVSNQEKSPYFLSHRGLKAFQLHSENPMMIYEGNIPLLDVLFLHFYPF